MQYRTMMGATLLTAALSAHTASAAPDGFVGTWLGVWPNGLEIELTVTDVDDDGYASGLYCNLRKTGIWFADLRREGGVTAAKITDDVLDFRIGKTRWQFSLEGDDTLELAHKRSGKKTKHLTVNRVDEGECANRVVPLK